LRISPVTLYRLIESGAIVPYRIGKKGYRLTAEILEAYLKEACVYKEREGGGGRP